MTKVEINGKTYCVETLIYTVERLTKEVKASAEYHRLVLEQIKTEIEEQVLENLSDGGDDWFTAEKVNKCLEIIDKYKTKKEE